MSLAPPRPAGTLKGLVLRLTLCDPKTRVLVPDYAIPHTPPYPATDSMNHTPLPRPALPHRGFCPVSRSKASIGRDQIRVHLI